MTVWPFLPSACLGSLLLAMMLGFLGCLASGTSPPELIAEGAEVIRVAEGFSFAEGPAADSDGNLFFSDVPSQRILKWSVGGELSVVRSASGGANGLYFDRDGNLIACEMVTRAITSTNPSGVVSILANGYAGKALNTTNDLWVAPNGGIYFTDPFYDDGTNSDVSRQDGNHVYYIPPDHSSVLRVTNDLLYPNGIVGTGDGRTLYVADSDAEKTFAYEIEPNGTLSNRRVAAEMGHDGLTLDEQQNLYVTHEVVEIYASDGRRIGTIETPEQPSNLTFGGADGRTLFITTPSSLYSIRMNVRGQRRN
jgi:gluconolactonase